MTTLKSVFADADSRKWIMVCAAFIGLNILDAWLTKVAVTAGSYELNPLLGARLFSSISFKGLISALLVLTLVLLKRGWLLKPLSVGMLLVCVWNGLAVWSWYVVSS